MPVLTLYAGKEKLKAFRLNPGGALTIGRLDKNTIVLDDPAVSNYHAEIESEGKQYFITDYQSRNGTFVNKELVISRQLNHGDQITIPPYTLIFGFLQGEENEASSPETSQATMHIDTSDHRSRLARSLSEMAEPDTKKGKVGCLECLKGDRDSLVLSESVVRIGKSSDCDIVVKGWMVGHTAAEIAKVEGNSYVLRFAGGSRKPKVNYKPVSKEVRLNEFDIIEVGSASLQFYYCKSEIQPGSQQTQEIGADEMMGGAPDENGGA
ncbi:MAG: FHA domain-containing protein [Desulfobacterales bacterium]|nr:FHA domain-containing protein [Desulfobacterales bacterium]